MNPQPKKIKVTEEDGELIATILKPEDSQEITGEVFNAIIPITDELLYRVSFYDMPHERAVMYATTRMMDVLAAIAQVSAGVAKEQESWYELKIEYRGQTLLKPQKFTKEISRAVEKDDLGWLNPIIVPFYGGAKNTWLLDVALTDEVKGRAVIEKLMKSWGIADWSLTVKSDGLFPG